MRKLFWTILILTAALVRPAAAAIPTPTEYLGFRPGDDYQLADWPQVIDYFRLVGEQSPRVNVRDIGLSSDGRPMIIAEISAPETIANLDSHRRNQALLADPRLIDDPDFERALADEAKVVVLLNCGLHATEIAATQMSIELVHELATSEDPRTLEILDRTIIVLVPSSNPDGLDMVADWYQRSLGQPWEGGAMPWLYQKYAGHDNNRDWFMLNLAETRHLTRVIYEEWRPAIVYDLHQMGNSGPRFFVPPFHDPRNPNVPPLIEQTLLVIGGQMARELSLAGRTGVIRDAMYDNWWSGGFRTTVYRHNMIGILSEAAGANLASPVFQRKSDLSGARRGMPQYAMTSNFPEPWPGGWWRPRDPIEYQKISVYALLTHAARSHDQINAQYIHLGRKAIEQGRSEPPYAWIVPPDQRDPATAAHMLEVLRLTGIEIHQAEEAFTVDGVSYPAGTYVLHTAQPYRPHLMDMMERQQYPNRLAHPGGPAESPYDIAGWTLPLMMGVRVVATHEPVLARARLLDRVEKPQGRLIDLDQPDMFGSYLPDYYRVVPGQNDDFRLLNRLARADIHVSVTTEMTFTGSLATIEGLRMFPPGTMYIQGDPLRRAMPGILEGLSVQLEGVERTVGEGGSFAITLPPSPSKTLRVPKLGIYQPWTASMTTGWTRFVLDQFEYDYEPIYNAQMRAGDLKSRFDTIILASISSSSILNGQAVDTTAPQYAGGIGDEGLLALQQFVRDGGTLICLDDATELPIRHFNIPVKNVLTGKKSTEFFCPGSILRARLDTTHPLAWGMPEWLSVYFAGSQAFELETTKAKDQWPAAPTVREVGRYADTLLLESGWIRGEDLIADKPCLAEVTYGRGRIVLIGFAALQRAQTHGTYRLFFNALALGPRD